VFDSAASILPAFAEDDWRSVSIGPFTLTVKGGCGRCIMVNVQPETGERNSALYALLNTCRKKEGRVLFGSLLSDLRHDDDAHATVTDGGVAPVTRWWPIRIGMACTAE
jgi:molybdenum cofactor sulfurtransferase